MTTTLQTLVSSQEQHADTGGDFIGSLVWWSLNGNRVAHARLKELADQHGVPTGYLPTEVRPASAFRRAWRHAANKLPQGLLLRQIDDTPTGIHIGLVKEQADAVQQELQYDQLVTIAFSKEHHIIQASGQHAVVEDLRSLYAHHLELTTRDIRSMLSNFVNETGVSLRESGGVYFIASPHQPIIEAMSATLKEIGHNQLQQLPLYDSPLAQDVLNSVAVATLDDELRKLGDELEGFMADDKTRPSTLRKRLEVFDSLRGRVKTFAGVLSFKSEHLLQQLGEMEQDLRQHLGIEVPSSSSADNRNKDTTLSSQPPLIPGDPGFPLPSVEAESHQEAPWSAHPSPIVPSPANADPLHCFDLDVGF